MAFDDLMATVSRWLVATEALAALGAELSLVRDGGAAPPELAAALHAVSTAAGLPDVAAIPPPRRDMVIGLIRMAVRQAADLLDEPGRPPGWAFTDGEILQGWGGGSTMVPAMLASAPELGDVHAFLDVGTGVGLLAIAAAGVWPEASIVGIDIWEPSLRRAADNVAGAAMGERITLRNQNVADVDETDAYDCAWFPTFFVTEAVFDAAMPRLYRALRPGGWLVLGGMAAPDDPLAESTVTLRTLRNGGTLLDATHLTDSLERTGCTAIRALPRRGPAPLVYVIGQRPA